MKTKSKVILSSILAVILVATSVLLGVQLFTQKSDNLTKGVYNGAFTAFADGTATETTAPEIGTMKGMVSTGSDYLLLATALKIENIATTKEYSAIGYEIKVDGGTATVYESDTYYTGISVKTSEATSKEWSMKDEKLFGSEEGVTGMIVAEIQYSVASAYSIKPYVKVANETETTDDDAISYGEETSVAKKYGMAVTTTLQATKDNEYASDKTLLGTYAWGSEGVTTNGTQAGTSDYTGGIKGLDAVGKYVEYTFTVTKAGRVDFIWNVAGNCWNTSVAGKNAGITMSTYMTVTLDGKPVNVSGITLPAGTGSSLNIWWNLQQVILKDVELTPGEHTFRYDNIKKGGSANVGSMDIYFVEDSNVEFYTAVKNNDYESTKTLLGEYVYGSEGVTTNGTDASKDYSKGIGSMDASGKYVTYTFTVDKDGKADFVWNVAGSKWNGTTKSNDGITNMANHMTVTIDGKPVNVRCIALPAGTGSASVWWNLQQIIVKDVKLTAGTHTFRCAITATGGLNIGSMEIYFG